MKSPDVLNLAILLADDSVNQTLPSGPAAMPTGTLLGVGTEYWVKTPDVVNFAT